MCQCVCTCVCTQIFACIMLLPGWVPRWDRTIFPFLFFFLCQYCLQERAMAHSRIYSELHEKTSKSQAQRHRPIIAQLSGALRKHQQLKNSLSHKEKKGEMDRGYSSGVERSSTMQKPQFNPWYYKKERRERRKKRGCRWREKKKKRNLTFYRDSTRRITLSSNYKDRHK